MTSATTSSHFKFDQQRRADGTSLFRRGQIVIKDFRTGETDKATV